MRRDDRVDARVPCPVILREKVLLIGEATIRFVRAVAGFLSDQSLTEVAADAGLLAGLRDAVLEVVHIEEGRSAGEKHLGDAVERAPVHEFRGHRLQLQWEQEAAQTVRAVVAHRTKRHHRHMAVRVHEARQQDAARPVDHLVRSRFRLLQAFDRLGSGDCLR